jgi:hypothetical protein
MKANLTRRAVVGLNTVFGPGKCTFTLDNLYFKCFDVALLNRCNSVSTRLPIVSYAHAGDIALNFHFVQ